METNTARSKKLLEDAGWQCHKTEYTMRVPGKYNGTYKEPDKVWKVDAFSFGDLLCYHPEHGIALIQTTDLGDISKRENKIIANVHSFGWLQAGGKIFVHGWKKVKNRWRVKIFEMNAAGTFSQVSGEEEDQYDFFAVSVPDPGLAEPF